MIIRREQVEALSAAPKETFVARMVEHLKGNFAADLLAHGLDATNLRMVVRSAVDRAESYGIVTRPDVRQYLEFMVTLGVDFDHADQVVREILQRPDAGPSEKLSAIDEYLLFGFETPR